MHLAIFCLDSEFDFNGRWFQHLRCYALFRSTYACIVKVVIFFCMTFFLRGMTTKYFIHLTELFHFCVLYSGKYALEEITTHLARELKKGAKSTYYPFLITLPDDVSFIPARWSDEKIHDMDIDGTQTEADLKAMRNKWHNDAHRWLSPSPHSSSIEGISSVDIYSESKSKEEKVGEKGVEEEVSVSDWVWARATLQARGFSFRGKHAQNSSPSLSDKDGTAAVPTCDDQNHNIVSFIPFITLSNHDDALGGVTTMGVEPVPSSSFTFRSGPATPKGHQLFNFYGEMSFQQKILSFGWVDRCLISSPEGFSITALSAHRDWDEDVSAEERNNVRGEREERETMHLEIRTNIHLGTVMADRRTARASVVAKGDRDIETPLTNDISLRITSLKFDIRNLIAKVVGEKGGRDRGVVVAELMKSLSEREERLLAGVRAPSTSSSLEGIAVDTIASNSQSKNESKKQQQQKKQVRQKGKVKQTSKEFEPGFVQSTSSGSASGGVEGESGRERETDGQRIRRLELESVRLLLQFLPLC